MSRRIGIYPDISHEEYHSIDEAVSNSYLSRLKHCPANARIKQEETPAMIFGRAFHALLLEGQGAFDKRFVVMPEGLNSRTKAGKEEWEAFQDTNKGKNIISKEDYEKMCEMVSAIAYHPFASKVLCQGRSEMSVFWEDKETGIYCKSRPDRIPDGDHGVILDIKTTNSADKKDFGFAIKRYGYHTQAAMYIDGYNTITNGTVDAFIFIAVEKKPPYKMGCFTLSDIDIAIGRGKYRELLKEELECRENGFYPNYDDEGLVEINLPNWD